jgi:hypothetical protein
MRGPVKSPSIKEYFLSIFSDRALLILECAPFFMHPRLCYNPACLTSCLSVKHSALVFMSQGTTQFYKNLYRF